MVQSDPIIQTENLTKVYTSRRSQTRALDRLNLSVQPGEIFGYLGPNGAGKTTTIRLLLDLIRPTAGRARIFGLDAQAHAVEIHRRVGFLPGELSLWRSLTGLQVIRHIANVRGMRDLRCAHQLAERLQLDLSKRVRDYSSGNRRKLGLVVAMMHEPELLILDEPTNGLDPLMQQEFNQMMREVRAEGRTVFLSSHVLGEVQAICDRVGILREGELRAVERVERLTHVDFRWVEMRFREDVPAAWRERLGDISGVSEVSIDGTTLRVRLQGDFDPLLRAVSGGYIRDLRVKEPTLEEIFLTFYDGDGKRAAQPERVKELA